MFERRARAGQCVNQPYLGCREFAASFRLVDLVDDGQDGWRVEEAEPMPVESYDAELGWMLYDMDFADASDPKPQFFARASSVACSISAVQRYGDDPAGAHRVLPSQGGRPRPGARLAAPGTEEREIPFVLELTRDGRLAGVTDTRSGDGRKKVGQRYRVPQGTKKTSGIAANLLWDNAEYVLACPDAKKLADAQAKGKGADYVARLADMQGAFIARINALPASAQADDGVRAVRAFLSARPAEACRHTAPEARSQRAIRY